MSGNVFDLTVLLSLKCTISALLPNITVTEQNSLITKARRILISHNKAQKVFENCSKTTINERKFRFEIFQKLTESTQIFLKDISVDLKRGIHLKPTEVTTLKE